MLPTIALVLSFVTLMMAVSRGRRLAAVDDQLRSLRYLEGSLRELRKEADLKLGLTRRHLAEVGSGKKLPADMILEGKPFADVGGQAGMKMLEETPSLFVLDVRTNHEFASGHIPSAKHIPVDQLESRLAELPGKGTTMLVTCAGGSRSAAACAMLAERGYTSLYNLASGMSGWRGAVEKGGPAA